MAAANANPPRGTTTFNQKRYAVIESSKQPIVLDTDIGTDVDDVVALALLLRAQAVDLQAITTVYVHAALRARMVKAVLEIAGRPAIRIGSGADLPLLNRDKPYWAGFEGEGLIDPHEQRDEHWTPATDLLIERVLARPGEVTILAIGPLTNVALALLREPRLARTVRRIVIMGGLVQRRFDQLRTPYSEHNIRCDPEAAQIVFSSGAPITLVPLDVTTQVRVQRDHLARLREGDALARMVADQLERYFGHMGRDWTCPHDPLAAAAILQPEFLRTFPMRVQVETHGEYTRAETVALLADEAGTDAPVIDVALEVEARRFESWLVDTLLNGC